MKRLGIYASIAILLLSVVGGLTHPVKALAEATVDPKTSYDYFKGSVDALQTAAITAIDTANQKYVGTSNAVAQQKVTDAFKTVANANYAAYTTTFNAERSKGTGAADAQIAAIQAWIRSSNDGNNLVMTRAYSSGPQRSAYNRYAIQIQDAVRVAQQAKARPVTLAEANATVDASTIVNAAAGNTNISKQVADPNPNDCSLFNGNLLGCINQLITWVIKNTLMQIAGFLLWLATNMFNYSVQVGILNFKDWAPDTLYPIWIIIRQIVSLIIVFVGLYLGILYILGREETFEKFIPWLVVFALFVNFSYPLARTAIDISNIISLKVYTSAVGNEALVPGTKSKNTAGAIILNRLGLTDLALSATSVEGGVNVLGRINSIPGALMAVAFICYAAFIFFMVTGIMVMRTAALVFLTIASPLLLVDSVLPMLGEKAKLLRKIFFEQLAVGPIFMIMLALTMKFLEVFSSPTGPIKATGVGLLAEKPDMAAATFFNLLMMLIMLHIMYKVTKSTAGTLGQYASDAMGKVGGFGLGLATGGAGLLARGTIGAAAAKFRDSNWVKNNQTSLIGRSSYAMSNSLAKSSYDLRNSKVVAGGMQKAGLSGGLFGVGMGAGRTIGYDQAVENKRKSILEGQDRAGERYKEDVKDEKGNIIHRRGDYTPEGRKALEKYNDNLGGRRFMTKEQKAKTTELLKENVLKNDAAEEAKVKKRAEEMSKTYNSVGKRSEDINKSKADLKKERDDALGKMQEDLGNLRKSDPQLRGLEAQALRGAINLIEDKREEEMVSFKRKIESLALKHKNMTGSDVEKRRTALMDGLDLDEQEALTERLERSDGVDIVLPDDATTSRSTTTGSTSTWRVTTDTEMNATGSEAKVNVPAYARQEKAKEEARAVEAARTTPVATAQAAPVQTQTAPQAATNQNQQNQSQPAANDTYQKELTNSIQDLASQQRDLVSTNTDLRRSLDDHGERVASSNRSLASSLDMQSERVSSSNRDLSQSLDEHGSRMAVSNKEIVDSHAELASSLRDTSKAISSMKELTTVSIASKFKAKKASSTSKPSGDPANASPVAAAA